MPVDYDRMKTFLLIALTSDQDGEVATAVRMLRKQLTENKLDVHAMAGRLLPGSDRDRQRAEDDIRRRQQQADEDIRRRRQQAEEEIRRQQKANAAQQPRYKHQDYAVWALANAGRFTTEWEKEFLTDMQYWPGGLTERQGQVLERIRLKLDARGLRP